MDKVLIIEDDKSIAELQRDYLEFNGFVVETQSDGEKGLLAAINNEFNLIIVDLMLPKVNGFDICKKIRSSKDIPILIVTARNEDIDIMRGLGLGADDYITKPFSPNELVARVKSHLARYNRLIHGGHNIRNEIHINGLFIDNSARKVFVNQREVILRTKEFDLLTFLATHPNRVFTKDDLFERIWGMESTGDNATVTVHIGKIRDKIESNPNNTQYIETVWGVGYRFKV